MKFVSCAVLSCRAISNYRHLAFERIWGTCVTKEQWGILSDTSSKQWGWVFRPKLGNGARKSMLIVSGKLSKSPGQIEVDILEYETNQTCKMCSEADPSPSSIGYSPQR